MKTLLENANRFLGEDEGTAVGNSIEEQIRYTARKIEAKAKQMAEEKITDPITTQALRDNGISFLKLHINALADLVKQGEK